MYGPTRTPNGELKFVNKVVDTLQTAMYIEHMEQHDYIELIAEVDYEVWPNGDPDRAYLVNFQPGERGYIINMRPTYAEVWLDRFDEDRGDDVIEVPLDSMRLVDTDDDE